jgi:serine O-acetyltransferase
MKFSELLFLIKSDLYKYNGKISSKIFLVNFLSNKAFITSFWYRICHYLYKNSNPLLNFTKLIFKQVCRRYALDLSYQTEIGSGLYLGHVIGIVMSPKAKLGKNVNISQGVTIGFASRGKNKGYPTIGNNVFIGPNVCIIGNIKIGNNVAIGANAVVAKDVPDNAVVAGIPAKIISYNGAEEYVIRNDYE